MLNERIVVETFRAILGREPENADVIAFHRKLGDAAALRLMLLRSPEFASLYARIEAQSLLGASALSVLERSADHAPAHADERPGSIPLLLARGILPPMDAIETMVDGDVRDALWRRVAAAWARLGGEAAHWSVLTHDAFRPDRLEVNRTAFEDSAEVEGVLVDAALERVPDVDAATMRCLEIGCGVGRATRALARRFRHVTGVDVSEPHLAIAGAELAAAGTANVEFKAVRGVADYGALARGHDFLFSRLVLQHNPPPVQAEILGQVFAALEPGAVVLFQVVTYGRRYAYRAATDGASGEGMEMHVLPQPDVFRIMAAADIAPIEVQEDFAAGRDGPFRSHLFLGRKAACPSAGCAP